MRAAVFSPICYQISADGRQSAITTPLPADLVYTGPDANPVARPTPELCYYLVENVGWAQSWSHLEPADAEIYPVSASNLKYPSLNEGSPD